MSRVATSPHPKPLGSLRLSLLAVLASSCASWHAPVSRLASDSRIGVTVTRSGQRFHVQVLVAARCPPAGTGPCPEGKPLSDLAVAVRTPSGDRALGTTWVDGGLDVSFAQIEALFSDATADKDKRAPLLVEGRIVAELPIGEIGSRHSIIEAAVRECDEALADPNLQSDYAQDLLGRMLDLQLLGLADDRLAELTTRLAERVRARPSVMWSQPTSRPERAKGLIAGVRAAGDEQDVPRDVQRELTHASPDSRIASASFRWALRWLPTVCQLTVKGGEILSQVVVTGVPGVALAVIEASVGDIYTHWLIESCCKSGSEALGAAEVPECR